MEGTISIHIQTSKMLSIGDTDISGSMEFPEKFLVYVSVLIRSEIDKFSFLDSQTNSSTILRSSCGWNKNSNRKFKI
jgi:hypothetical protein